MRPGARGLGARGPGVRGWRSMSPQSLQSLHGHGPRPRPPPPMGGPGPGRQTVCRPNRPPMGGPGSGRQTVCPPNRPPGRQTVYRAAKPSAHSSKTVCSQLPSSSRQGSRTPVTRGNTRGRWCGKWMCPIREYIEYLSKSTIIILEHKMTIDEFQGISKESTISQKSYVTQ